MSEEDFTDEESSYFSIRSIQPGEIIDQFKVLQFIGEGGFGAVYQA